MYKWLIVLLATILLVGCGESDKDRREAERKERREAERQERIDREQKINQTTSKVNVLAEKLTQITEDGWFKQEPVEETDTWGNKLEAKYKRVGGYETLVVWSNGPDGLPYTRDDIRSISWTIDNAKVIEAIRKARHENRKVGVEDISSSLTKGLTSGVLKAWREKKDGK